LLNKTIQVFILDAQKVDVALEKDYRLVVSVVSLQTNKPIKNVNVKVFRLEKTPITLAEWAENLKNGSPFKKLMFSMNTDNNGNVTAELAEGSYEVKVEEYTLSKVCELTHEDRILFIEPKKHWWQ
jgi:formylglycine-generating enzyme required for sulfatase activity